MTTPQSYFLWKVCYMIFVKLRKLLTDITKLTHLWQQQVDVLEKYKCKDPEDEVTHKQSIKKKIHVSHGLNQNVDEVSGRILAVKPLPTIQEAFSKVTR